MLVLNRMQLYEHRDELGDLAKKLQTANSVKQKVNQFPEPAIGKHSESRGRFIIGIATNTNQSNVHDNWVWTPALNVSLQFVEFWENETDLTEFILKSIHIVLRHAEYEGALELHWHGIEYQDGTNVFNSHYHLTPKHRPKRLYDASHIPSALSFERELEETAQITKVLNFVNDYISRELIVGCKSDLSCEVKS